MIIEQQIHEAEEKLIALRIELAQRDEPIPARVLREWLEGWELILNSFDSRVEALEKFAHSIDPGRAKDAKISVPTEPIPY